ncbi:MAG TPA: hypothetical protein VEL74_10090, partial [Thermoanaerobaculia bacterium]|nr:hypothetical protein [Thermoanaerobaculia bacterium]
MTRLRLLRPLLCLLSILAAAPVPSAVAGTGFWSPLGPEGASVTALVVDPTGAVYAAARRGGIYKSSTGGDTWGLLSRGTGSETIVALAATPRPFGPIYAAGESGAVFKTVDGGGNWVRVWAGAPQPDGNVAATFSLATDARRPDTLFAGTRQGVYRSTDGGITWARRGNLAGAVRSLANDAAGGWLYAGVDGQGVFRSFNQGGTWERISAGLPPNPFFFSLAFDPDRPRTLLATTPAGLYRSVDRGRRWQRVAGAPDVNALAVVFQRGGRAYAAFTGGIFYSTDSGATWRRSANLPGRVFGDPRSLAAGTDRVFVGVLGDSDGPGLYRSLDFGATFQPAIEDLQGLAVTTVAVAPSDPETIYAAVSNSLFKTTDGGTNWTRVSIPHLESSFYPISDILV